MAIHFEDNSMQVKEALEAAAVAYLYKAGGELEAQTKRNSRVGTGQLKNSWRYVVDLDKLECKVGSPLQNAIWEEFGTGEFALHGDGRKGGWTYRDDITGKWYHTHGKTPHRALQRAFNSLKKALIRMAEQVLKGRMQ